MAASPEPIPADEEVTAVTPVSVQIFQIMEGIRLAPIQRRILKVIAESADQPDRYMNPGDVVAIIKERSGKITSWSAVTALLDCMNSDFSDALLEVIWKDTTHFRIEKVTEDFSEDTTGTIDAPDI